MSIRKLLVCSALCSSLLAGSAATAAEGAPVTDPAVLSELQQSAFTPLFDALKAGDLRSISALLSRDIYPEYKRLLEENTEYDDFLRDYYRDAVFLLENVVATPSGYVGSVRVYWPDGQSEEFQLTVSAPDSRGNRHVAPERGHR